MSDPQSRRKLRILHVEDNPGDVYVVRRALRSYSTPSELHTIENGEAAITYLHECKSDLSTRPDLVLLDINLPLINGDEVLKWIRSEENLQDLPVIVLSSSNSSRDIEKMHRYGANAYVTKPDDIREFGKVFQAIDSNCNPNLD
jgi:CheY-like chemotaxis protein